MRVRDPLNLDAELIVARRPCGQHLALALRRARPGTSLHLIVDSTGLSIVGEGEWAAAQHGGRGRRGWRKLHLGVDGSRVIVACALTEPTADDAMTGIRLVDEVEGHFTRVTADPAYDTLACYGAAGARGARVVVPPTKTASLSRRGARSGARDRTIRRVKALGRRRWKKASGSHQHARVENAFFRYTSIVGDCLRARSSSGQRREAVLACNVLNRMTELGRPGRGLVTRIGKLELRVPRDREGRFSTELFDRFQRSEKALVTALAEMYVQGVSTQPPEDRCQDALGLTQRSVEDETERQGGFDGEIGILEWPAPPADASRCPRGDRVGREPEGDVASPHEGSVVLGPVPDAILCLVLRMHSRLHIEIMTRRRSRWSTCRPLLAHRAESAHQRRLSPSHDDKTPHDGFPSVRADQLVGISGPLIQLQGRRAR